MRDPLYAKLLLFFLVPDVLLAQYLYMRDALPVLPFVAALLVFFLYGAPLDIYATKHKVWAYNFKKSWGIKLFGMPLEEYLFYFIVIPLPMLLFLALTTFT